jgi:hypothetical protein
MENVPVALVGLFIVACMVATMLLALGWFVWFIWWICHNAEIASQVTRQGATPEASRPPAGPSFTLTYKEGRKTKSVVIPAATEQQAVAAAMRMSIPFDKIVSLTPN